MNEMSISIAISVTALLISFYFSSISKSRNEKNDAKRDSSELTTVIVKLENISSGVTEIKSDLKNIKNDVQENRERIIRVEESNAQMQRQLDSLRKESNHKEENI